MLGEISEGRFKKEDLAFHSRCTDPLRSNLLLIAVGWKQSAHCSVMVMSVEKRV